MSLLPLKATYSDTPQQPWRRQRI